MVNYLYIFFDLDTTFFQVVDILFVNQVNFKMLKFEHCKSDRYLRIKQIKKYCTLLRRQKQIVK